MTLAAPGAECRFKFRRGVGVLQRKRPHGGAPQSREMRSATKHLAQVVRQRTHVCTRRTGQFQSDIRRFEINQGELFNAHDARRQPRRLSLARQFVRALPRAFYRRKRRWNLLDYPPESMQCDGQLRAIDAHRLRSGDLPIRVVAVSGLAEPHQSAIFF